MSVLARRDSRTQVLRNFLISSETVKTLSEGNCLHLLMLENTDQVLLLQGTFKMYRTINHKVIKKMYMFSKYLRFWFLSFYD